MRENKIENRLKKRVREKGGLCIKVKFPGYRGAPDRLVLFAKKHFLAELKATGEKPRAEQLRLHILLRKAGFQVEVIDSYERIEEVLRNA